MIKGLKSYVKAILGEGSLDNFNDFEKGVIFMERSRLDTSMPSRAEFETALEFAKEGISGLEDYDGPKIIEHVAKLSVELLEIQLEIFDKHPEIQDWTYRKSIEITKSEEDLCNRMDFLAGKMYQLMPVYSKEMELQYVKDWMNR